MKKLVRIYNMRTPEEVEASRQWWSGRSAEERLDAVEVLRRQFGKLPPGDNYDGSQRLRRVLRIVQ